MLNIVKNEADWKVVSFIKHEKKLYPASLIGSVFVRLEECLCGGASGVGGGLMICFKKQRHQSGCGPAVPLHICLMLLIRI